jgi:hypothetical protein
MEYGDVRGKKTWETHRQSGEIIGKHQHILGKSWEMHWIWVNYNDLTTTSLGIMVSKGNHPQMGLIQVGELL